MADFARQQKPTKYDLEAMDVHAPGYLMVGKVVAYAMYVLVIFAEILLAFRIFLLAFSANAATPFVNFVYTTSADFLDPFRGIFPPRPLNETGYLDVAALFAMIVYGLLLWGISAIISFVNHKISESKLRAYLHHQPPKDSAS